jgi:aspartyl/asparaginyl beta-hydroxylase (cupin superfamily)
MFYSAHDFPFAADLEARWDAIRAEYERLAAQDFMAWPERHLYNQGWEVFGLYAFGRRLDQNCQRCPETAQAVESIPGMTTAGFSQLAPRAHIQPHVGYTSAVLRCHLGVLVPEGCELRVGPETRTWQAGKCLVFDDTTEHEAWNRSQSPRTVLLIDFKRPDSSLNLSVPASVATIVDRLAASPSDNSR